MFHVASFFFGCQLSCTLVQLHFKICFICLDLKCQTCAYELPFSCV